jgi:hypothetical protein
LPRCIKTGEARIGEKALETGIYIRVFVGRKVESIDIGDPQLRADQLLEWMLTKDDEFIVRLMDKLRNGLTTIEG